MTNTNGPADRAPTPDGSARPPGLTPEADDFTGPPPRRSGGYRSPDEQRQAASASAEDAEDMTHTRESLHGSRAGSSAVPPAEAQSAGGAPPVGPRPGPPPVQEEQGSAPDQPDVKESQPMEPAAGAPAPAQQARVTPMPPQGPGPRPMGAHSVAVPVRETGPFRRGFGLGAGAGAGVAVALLTLGTALSLISALAFGIIGALSSNNTTSPALATVWGEPSATHSLRAIDVTGSILTDASGGGLLAAGTYGYEVARTLNELEAEDAEGVILRMNTPGGTVTGSKAIADAVVRYRERTGKKVYAHVQGMSASGGMYAMANADSIQADHGSLVGSIGVIFGPFSRYTDVTSLDEGLLGGGVTAESIEQYYLTQGRGKDAGNPFRDLTDEERDVLVGGMENEYANFVNHVSAGREIPADRIRNQLGAHLYDNKTAQDNGLIDGTMGIDEAYAHFATIAGLDPSDTKVMASTAPTFLDSLLGAENRLPGQALPVATQSGVRPVTAAAMCGPAPVVLAFHGDPSALCG